jgi:hypothetical protein
LSKYRISTSTPFFVNRSFTSATFHGNHPGQALYPMTIRVDGDLCDIPNSHAVVEAATPVTAIALVNTDNSRVSLRDVTSETPVKLS